MNFELYENKKVFITGHTGFKGSWLLTWLTRLGAHVKGYSLPPDSDQSLFNKIDGSSMCQSVIGDILDRNLLEHEILEFQPDYIFHLAAQPLVRLSYEIPVETFDVNVIGTANLLNAIRKLDNSCVVVIVTTDKVYENKEWNYPYRETDSLGGYDAYSASKACAELVVNSFRYSFFNPSHYQKHKKAIASARAGNVIGGGDWSKDRIIPDIITALHNDQPIPVRNPTSVRPWQHVLEPLSGYLQLAKKMTEDPIPYSDSWNFGPYNEETLTVEEVVKLAIEVWGQGRMTTVTNNDSPHEAKLLKLDISKTLNHLGWRPAMTSKEAITATIKWYKNSSHTPERALVQNDIERFVNSKLLPA